MGLCVSKSNKSVSSYSPYAQSEASPPRLTGASPSSSLNGASQIDNVSDSLFNPNNDPRVDRLIQFIVQLYPQSATLRRTLNKLAEQGGAFLYIVPDDQIHNSYGHAETIPSTRSIRIGENAIADIEGHGYHQLNTCLIELTNLSNIDSFARVRQSFLAGNTSVERAAKESEKAEYGTIKDMMKYYEEAQEGIADLGYGNPSLWYMSTDPETQQIQPGYRSFDDYYLNAQRTGHTDVYLQNYQQLANYRA